MILSLTVKDFLKNPMGKGNSTFPNRQLVIDDLNRRYDALIKNKKIEVTIYKDGDEYYLHFIMPSESERDNTYDVIIQYTIERETDDNNKFNVDTTLKYNNFTNNYFIKVFSNCPSFTYTYAYVCHMNDILIPFLSDKFDDIVLSDNPLVRNPGEVMGFEKSIYFACLFIQKNQKYTNKMFLNSYAKKFDESLLFHKIRTTDKIKIEIDQANSVLKKKKQNEKKVEVKIPTTSRNTNNKAVKQSKPVTAKPKIRSTIKPKAKIRPK